MPALIASEVAVPAPIVSEIAPADTAWIQALAVAVALLYSAGASFALYKLTSLAVGLRVDDVEEGRGLDVPLHGEQATSSGEGALLLTRAETLELPGVFSNLGESHGRSS
ncbi:MAG: hypothetical protein QF903_09580 [Planctomycetota bacterium]|jgi:Amt family ammonium transporter|nr:hypothetical protein [Planctomycetota bacterium]MDP6763608.1 hypothetical protein [Planctomycetota bacterium]MDP6989715.1 hypothetical protein [Planctomycetota bacterium]